MGCGPGVYVQRHAVESEVCQGLSELLSVCADPDGFARQVNMELRRMWQESTGYSDHTTALREIERVEARIAHIRRAIEEGLDDAPWVNSRLRELGAERDALAATLNAPGPPQLDTETVMAYRRQTVKLMQCGQPAERKRLLRTWVQEIKLEPEKLVVKISYRLPEAVMKGVVAGAGFEPATFGL
jgi:hypothetical protein